MIIRIDPSNRHQLKELAEQCQRMRHEIFVEEMGWRNLRRADGKEVDDFDASNAVEFAYVADNEIVGYQRLLPTTGPHLLADVFPFLCDGPTPRQSSIWEWSRYAVRRDHRGDGRAPSEVSIALASSLVEWAVSNGVISFVCEIPPLQMIRLAYCHFKAVPLGIPHVVGGSEVIGCQIFYDDRTIERLRSVRPGSNRGKSSTVAA